MLLMQTRGRCDEPERPKSSAALLSVPSRLFPIHSPMIHLQLAEVDRKIGLLAHKGVFTLCQIEIHFVNDLERLCWISLKDRYELLYTRDLEIHIDSKIGSN